MNLPKTEEELKEFCIELVTSRCIGHTLTSKCYDRFIEERNKPKLYEGLTKEQWGRTIEDELLCVLTSPVFEDVISSVYKVVYDEDSDARFYISEDDWRDNKYYTSCVIHYSQTQFNTGKKPDWLDDKQLIACKLSDVMLVTKTADWFNWELDIESSIIRWQVVKV